MAIQTQLLLDIAVSVTARGTTVYDETTLPTVFWMLFVISVLVMIVLTMVLKARAAITQNSITEVPEIDVTALSLSDIEHLIEARKRHRADTKTRSTITRTIVLMLLSLFTGSAYGQSNPSSGVLFQPGILITIALIGIPLILGILFFIFRLKHMLRHYHRINARRVADRMTDHLLEDENESLELVLEKRRAALSRQLTNHELSGEAVPDDSLAIVRRLERNAGLPFVAPKKRSIRRPPPDPALSRLVLWYLGTSIFWLLFGTTIGVYVGVKFLTPDVDHQSWLSFGRLRPVHTNAVFWGWSSLAMLGLGHYVVYIVGNARLHNLGVGWISLILINLAVVSGTVCLMAGVNNGGGEYREYIWPVMLLFAVALVMTLVNFINTIARRKTREIYISNWYIVSAIIFTIVIVFIAYWPTWQSGLGETIVQGYYMHQGVGMWFMLFTLGLVYYFLPQQLNKPIYSYSLGILAFWTQILFYTLIGTHHFVFSSIPWSLQTVAIVGSMGMVIPVVAGTTNFLLTFKGDLDRVSTSYTLPFFLVGVVFYLTGSLQGTAEAFRFTNLVWHFTDFTVAHSHLTMYGIVAFFLWGCIYAVVPRLTGREPRHLLVGAHFWFAFIGLLLYSIPLMVGGTLKGLEWMKGTIFIETVTMMAPYWLWRAIGGTLMWLSHVIFAFNFYKMMVPEKGGGVEAIVLDNIRKMSIGTTTGSQVIN